MSERERRHSCWKRRATPTSTRISSRSPSRQLTPAASQRSRGVATGRSCALDATAARVLAPSSTETRGSAASRPLCSESRRPASNPGRFRPDRAGISLDRGSPACPWIEGGREVTCVMAVAEHRGGGPGTRRNTAVVEAVREGGRRRQGKGASSLRP
jgi:hypothetical protein